MDNNDAVIIEQSNRKSKKFSSKLSPIQSSDLSSNSKIDVERNEHKSGGDTGKFENACEEPSNNDEIRPNKPSFAKNIFCLYPDEPILYSLDRILQKIIKPETNTNSVRKLYKCKSFSCFETSSSSCETIFTDNALTLNSSFGNLSTTVFVTPNTSIARQFGNSEIIEELSNFAEFKNDLKDESFDKQRDEKTSVKSIERILDNRFIALHEAEAVPCADDLKQKEQLTRKDVSFKNPLELGEKKTSPASRRKSTKKSMKLNEKSYYKCTTLPSSTNSRKSKKPKVIDVKWALARINLFDDKSKTYEIMQSPDNSVPDVIFAVLPNRTTVCYEEVLDE